MSEDGVYPSSVPSFVDVPSFVECSFLFGDVEFESPHSRFILGVEVARCSIFVGSWCVQSGPKLFYRNSESFQKFEVRMN